MKPLRTLLALLLPLAAPVAGNPQSTAKAPADPPRGIVSAVAITTDGARIAAGTG